MKRKLFALALSCLAVLPLLTACGSAGGSTAASGNGEMRDDMQMESTAGGDMAPAAPQSFQEDAKRIYTAQVQMETTEFDSAASSIAELVEELGGWFESSSVSSYGSGYRYGNYTVRVPADQYTPFLSQVGTLCHVTYQSQGTEDVTEVYYDTSGRLKTQQVKLERLQELLRRAETMEDIITVESAISETEAQIEALSGELQRYDHLVDYSTVYLSLDEVYRLSNVEEPVSTLSGRLGAAFSSGWKDFTGFLESLVVALAYGWVWVVVLIAVAAVVLRRLRLRRGNAGRISEKQKRDDKTE
ncbi:DUF4349 domain-containing protein [Oscillibacter sp. MSJ-2]|uniref:DUF4349 domain-containing protein n=1 Tax=Dysosmobacter acutus TaxID=2841504 RepID=A0ABS6FCU0_9FIRM|nr:DUF4349 domain-containing protein [Dysosmobacter acutus]MBU5628103.1 DUF4349 domain-containing protein [Dysosmobacter acutus]